MILASKFWILLYIIEVNFRSTTPNRQSIVYLAMIVTKEYMLSVNRWEFNFSWIPRQRPYEIDVNTFST